MTEYPKLAEIIELNLDEFLAIHPAPGHRDSAARAASAYHLHKLVPEHLDVEIAEWRDSGGRPRRGRMTGNTRAEVWAKGLSDAKPMTVRAKLYRMANEEEVRERMLRQDSKSAAWTSADYVYRAFDMTYGDTWRPSSTALRRGTRLVMPIRRANAIAFENKLSSDADTNIAILMPKWADEIKMADDILNRHSILEDTAKLKPLQSGFLAGIILLLKFEPRRDVEKFITAIFNGEGEQKPDIGKNGVQAVLENMERLIDRKIKQPAMTNATIGGFVRWKEENYSKDASKKVETFDVVQWAQDHSMPKQEHQRLSKEA